MKKNKLFIIVLFMFIQSCNEKTEVDLGNGYRFDYDPVVSTDYAIFGPYRNTYAVAGQVLKYNFDSIFIIAEQKPRDLILRNIINNNSDLSYEEVEKKFSKSPIKQYWIINKTIDSIYGPFTIEKYIKKRKELGVPPELKLKE